MATKKAVATKQNTALDFSDERPDWANEQRGSEEVTTADINIPRLGLTQALSPQINSRKPEYIEGAEQGMFFNIASGQLYGSTVTFIPVYFRKEFIIWRKIEEGGGFRGAFGTHEEALRTLNAMEDKDDCEIVDTGQHFGLVLNPDGLTVDRIVMSCATTKHKPSRKLNTLVQMTGADRWATAYELRAVEAENKAGQEYWNFDVRKLGWVPEWMYKLGEEAYEQVKSGAMDVDRRQQADSGVTRPEDLDG